jgi:hypothetical protein
MSRVALIVDAMYVMNELLLLLCATMYNVCATTALKAILVAPLSRVHSRWRRLYYYR